MLHLYTKNADGTINYYGEGDYVALQAYIKKHDLDNYELTTAEPVTAQGKYWLDETNSDYLAAKALDDKAKADAEKLAQEEASKPTVSDRVTQLESDVNLITEALDSLIMDDDSTEAESDSSDSDTNTTSN